MAFLCRRTQARGIRGALRRRYAPPSPRSGRSRADRPPGRRPSAPAGRRCCGDGRQALALRAGDTVAGQVGLGDHHQLSTRYHDAVVMAFSTPTTPGLAPDRARGLRGVALAELLDHAVRGAGALVPRRRPARRSARGHAASRRSPRRRTAVREPTAPARTSSSTASGRTAG